MASTSSLDTPKPIDESRSFRPPVKLIAQEDWPNITDDLDFNEMQLAIARQMKKFYRINLKSKITLSSHKYTTKILPASLLAFQKYMNEAKDCIATQNNRDNCYSVLSAELKENFYMFNPNGQSATEGSLFTGYYTPTIEASAERSEEFAWGVYEKPRSTKQSKLSRQEIDFKNQLIGSGYDHHYTNDLYANYLLHIEGGGRLKIKDANGQERFQYLTYDGTNQQSFRFIFKYMLEKNYIQSASIVAQERFLLANPDKWEEIYSTCPSYVFFKPVDHPPLGNEGTPLTNGRSIATDSKLYQMKGLLSFVKARKSVRLDERGNVVKEAFSRFFIDHDTGGAIKGSARADLFMGEDDAAKFASFYLYDKGSMHFLALKPEKADVWYKIFDKLKGLHEKELANTQNVSNLNPSLF